MAFPPGGELKPAYNGESREPGLRVLRLLGMALLCHSHNYCASLLFQ